MKIERLARKGILRMTPYIAGKSIEEVEKELGAKKWIKLASNENLLGPSPKAVEAMGQELPTIYLYPDGPCPLLREALAQKFSLSERMVVISNGADNLIVMIANAFVNEGDEVVMADPTFPVYTNVTQIMGGKVIKVKLKDYTHDLNGMLKKVNRKTKLVFVCNPNNPTGTKISREKIIDILQRTKGTVVVDECNYEYLGETVVDLIDEYENLIISRSFSKNFGLAGLRLGFAVSNPQNIKKLAFFGQEFRINRMAEKAAEKVLKYLDYYQEAWDKIRKIRDNFVKQVNNLGFTAYNSKSNLVLVEFKGKRETERVWKYLQENGIYTLPGWEKEFSGLGDQFIRFTVGEEWEMDKVIKVLTEYQFYK